MLPTITWTLTEGLLHLGVPISLVSVRRTAVTSPAYACDQLEYTGEPRPLWHQALGCIQPRPRVMLPHRHRGKQLLRPWRF